MEGLGYITEWTSRDGRIVTNEAGIARAALQAAGTKISIECNFRLRLYNSFRRLQSELGGVKNGLVGSTPVQIPDD